MSVDQSSSDELLAEQAYITHAYGCLDRARERATRLRNLSQAGAGGTHQARYERDVIEEQVRSRLAQLEVGDASLIFGRIDNQDGRYYIGRLAVSDAEQEPIVVDWRAPVAEPFYRATGREPLGLNRRRHFATRGRELLGIEDEIFGIDGAQRETKLQGEGALLAAIDMPRTGRLTDIVATIQGEQDEIIRAPMPGVMVVQGGPGTGKTVVALHRAAYLLYTFRFPLEDQGVMVVGPNRLFLGYIERVLPSLGEAGVHLRVIADLAPEVTATAIDSPAVRYLKGDVRMVDVLKRAVRDRQRKLREDLVIGFGAMYLSLSVEKSAYIVGQARRRFRTHNSARSFVEQSVFEALAASGREEVDPAAVKARVRSWPGVRAALDWMWPVLTPQQLLHDLFGSKSLLRSAARRAMPESDIVLLHRPRVRISSPDPHVVARQLEHDVPWTDSDLPLLDEARSMLGVRKKARPTADDRNRTYGHVVIDEAQDLSPMQLRVIGRRSLGGAMTLVGDIAQATGPWAPESWDEVLAHLPDKKPPTFRELTIGYRIPGRAMAVAAPVLAAAAPQLDPPTSVRDGDHEPAFVRAWNRSLGEAVIEVVRAERAIEGMASIALITPDPLMGEITAALEASGLHFGQASRRGLNEGITLVPVRLVKGLEVDSAIVVEPMTIVSDESQGLRALYVALTRATQRLTIVHADDLPAPLLKARDSIT